MDDMIIYVAGNPGAYPIEYYDTETESFQGMIPELLRRFSSESGYDVRYYSSGTRDRRGELADNLQVDVLSGVTDTDLFRHIQDKDEILLDTVEGGNQLTYRLQFTEVCPEEFRESLSSFLLKETQEMKTGMLIEASSQYPPVNKNRMRLALGFGIFLTLFLLFVILMQIRRYRRLKASLTRKNETDVETGIENRECLERYFRSHVHDKTRVLYSMYYFYVDTKRFDQMRGHQDTVQFLKQMLEILKNYVTESGILARVSEDGFVLMRLIGFGGTDTQWATEALERIKGQFDNSRHDNALHIAMSMYQLKSEDHTLSNILFTVGQCAWEACRQGEDFRVCTNDEIEAIAERQRLQADVKRALDNGEFQLYIQYYVDTASGRILGGEGLSRWEHPARGLIMPGQFVPLLVAGSLISQLDYYCLDKVCAFLQGLCQKGRDEFFVSCNLSAETMFSGDFLKKCSDIMDAYTFPRELLILEIDETVLQNDNIRTQTVRKLKEMGVGIILDDSNEGFSAFMELNDCQIDGIKLDRKLVGCIGTPAGDSSIQAIIQVCHELEITAVAEGVETRSQLEFLQRQDCDAVQGYYIYHPIPEWEVQKAILQQ